MAVRPLPSRDLVRQLLAYDPDTGEFIWRARPQEMFSMERVFLSWNTRYAGRPAGSGKPKKRVEIGISTTQHLAHRLAWLYVYGEPVPEIIDHADLDPSNNRIDNLRNATHAQNITNTLARKRNKLGVKGVHFDTRGKFFAQIMHNGKAINLGRFDALEDAAEAYRKAATKLHGAFSRY